MTKVHVAICTRCEFAKADRRFTPMDEAARAHRLETKHPVRFAEGWTEDTTGTVEVRRFYA